MLQKQNPNNTNYEDENYYVHAMFLALRPASNMLNANGERFQTLPSNFFSGKVSANDEPDKKKFQRLYIQMTYIWINILGFEKTTQTIFYYK